MAVHGGAGVLSRELADNVNQDECREALEAALRAGYAELQNSGATSIDAVLAAVRSLEDSPCFNAAKGAAFARDGRIELDAAVMDGATRRAGAVAGVTTVKNPIVAARLVLERSAHVMLIGPAADAFARQHGAEIVDPAYFRTERRWQMLQAELGKHAGTPDGHAESRFGTVGCVALDARASLAAGTSTGGMTGKLPGRVGDTPIIGGGTLADNVSCAVSATGDGEYFIRAVAAHDIAALVEYKGLSVAEAAWIVIHEKIKPAGGEGGVIVLDPHGNLAMTFSSEGMYRGYVTRSGETRVMIYRLIPC
ncbi:MAG: isoaspartyl peptidase/L-asparaginase family protein [Thermoguttaceae bacterium]